MTRSVQTVEDLLRLLDSLFEPDADRWTPAGASWWDRFYADRDRGVPFLRQAPEESLVAWQENGRLPLRAGARVLELGCGPGRNAVWLAQRGYQVDALDLSERALRRAAQRAAQADVQVNFVQASIFEWDPPEAGYDLVFDSGCFHHLPPHRRISYRALLERALAPGGLFALSCFAAGAMGSEAPDEEFYRSRQLSGGLAYTDEDLRSIFGWLQEVQLRRMRERHRTRRCSASRSSGSACSAGPRNRPTPPAGPEQHRRRRPAPWQHGRSGSPFDLGHELPLMS